MGVESVLAPFVRQAENIQPVRRAVTGDCYAANDAKGS